MAARDGSVVQISPDGEYLAFSSADGNLKIWETSTGLLSQEYVPSSHLSATCTCLSWCPRRHSRDTKEKKKKRRASITAAVEKLDLIALGTTSGSLLLYSVVKGDLHTQSENHNSTVHGICWSADGSSIFTGSEDSHISEWCLSTATVKQKWKDGKNPVHAVVLLPDQKHLLSASRKIKLWDIEKKEIVMNFAGHSMEVQWLVPLQMCCENGGDTPLSYFLSATPHERHISVWQISGSSNASVKQALASFSLSHEPAYVHLQPPTQEGQPFLLLVVTKTGLLQIFEHTLNGRLKKPVKPKVSVQVAAESSKGPHPVSILGAHVCDDSDRNILFSYGSILKPVFETKAYGSFESEACLLREDPSRTLVKEAPSVSKVKTPEVSQQLTVLAPEHLAPGGPSTESKNKRKRRKSTDLTMEQRLNAITIDKPSSDLYHGKHPPQADSLTTLLAQGLQSRDKKILNHVLQNKNKKMVDNTVKKLPLPMVVPLVQELSQRMYGHAQSGQTAIIWVKAVLTIHTAYLMSFPQLVDSFSGLYRMMESRVSVFSHLSKLQGKLDLMVSQLSSQAQEEEDTEGTQQPMLVYQDESSDEDLGFNSLIPDHSESEDNWEDDYKPSTRKDSTSDSDMEVTDDSDDGD